MYTKRLVVFISIFSFLGFFNPSLAFASAPRVDLTPNSFNFVEGSSETVHVSLDDPIICEDPYATCNIVLNLTSSDPSRVSVSPDIVTIPADEWYQVQSITISAVNSDTFSNGETVTISSAPVVSAAEFYSGFQPPNVSVTLPPAPAPVVANKTLSVVSNGTGVAVNVLDGATNNPDPSTITIISGPSHGTAVDPVGTITYTANTGYVGSDSLTYKVCSSLESSMCSTATLNFNISAAAAAATTAGSPDTGFGVYTNNALEDLLVFSSGFLSLVILAVSCKYFVRNYKI